MCVEKSARRVYVHQVPVYVTCVPVYVTCAPVRVPTWSTHTHTFPTGLMATFSFENLLLFLLFLFSSSFHQALRLENNAILV